MESRNEKIPEAAMENPLGYAPVGGLIRKFAIPSIISLLVTAAYNITDQIFIGHVVGMLGNAATNVAFPTTTLINSLAQLIGIGAAANFNINMGAKRPEEARRFVGNGLGLMSFVGVLLMCVVLAFKTSILNLSGATENVLPYAQDYLGITALGIPFFLFTMAGSQLVRADGSPTYAMVCTVSGAVLNVFLDWLFMFVFKWGIQGAAAATVIGQVASFILCIGYFPRFKSFRIVIGCLRPNPRFVMGIMKLGTPNFLNQIVLMLVNIVMNNTLTHYGALTIYGSDIPLAVSGVVAKLNSILVAFAVGLAQGCQPILGFNMGAGNYPRVKEAFRKAAAAAVLISMVFFASFQLFPRQIISIFGTGDELYFSFAEQFLRVFKLMVCFFGIQPLTVNYFSSIGSVRQGIVLSLSRQGFLLIPLLIVLPRLFGLSGILYAGPIADTLALALSLFFVFRSFKKLTALQRQQEVAA